MNLRFGRGSTSARAGRGLGEGQDESGCGIENGNGESQEVPLLGPPPPPPMTHAKMIAKTLAAHRESARAMELLAQAIGGFARGGLGGNGGNRGGASSLERPYSY
jgi:hypothetical protein